MTSPEFVIRYAPDPGRGWKPAWLARFDETTGQHEQLAIFTRPVPSWEQRELLDRLNATTSPAKPDEEYLPVAELVEDGRSYERLCNRRQALEVASGIFGSVTYSRDGDPSPADEVLAAARAFAAFLDTDLTPAPSSGPSEIRFRIPQGEVPPARTDPAPESCGHTTRTPIEARYGCCAPVKEA